MKIRQNYWSSFKNIAGWALSLSFGILLVLFAIRLSPLPSAQAQTPTPNCAATATPTPTPTATFHPPICASCPPMASPYPTSSPYFVLIPSFYQQPDNAQLAWIVYPPTTPTPTVSPLPSPPGIVLIHGGGYCSGSARGNRDVASDLANAGYYVVSVSYELAPCGLIPDQPCHEDDPIDMPGFRVTQQTNDIKAFVGALRADPHVDSTKIGVVGGSAGATHAVWVALDTTDTGDAWPHWNADARPQCAVMLSAAYDFSDWTPPPHQIECPPGFIVDAENYVQTGDLTTLKDWSPVSLVPSPEQFRPLFMINSWEDPTPYHQMVDMICALNSAGVPNSAYQTLTIPNSYEHGFAYWYSLDGQPGSTNLIKDDVIAFFDAHLR